MKRNNFLYALSLRAAILIGAVASLISCNNFKADGLQRLKLDPINDSLSLPDNFKLVVVAEGVGKARHMSVRDNGDIYLNLQSTKKDSALVALRDSNGDGKADEIKYFEDYQGTGITIEEPYLYASSRTEVFRYKFNGNALLPNLKRDTLIYGFEKKTVHHPKSFTFDNDGNIYVNVGAPSNACMEQFRTTKSPGKNPCPELELNAGIWKYKKDVLRQKHGESGTRYATGIRNAMALDWSEVNGGLYAMTHGRDQLNTLWPGKFTDEQNAELPSEEFLKVNKGDNFGWPYCYNDHFQGKKVLAPEYGGDGKIIGRCEGMKAPLIGFPAHWAPMDLLFYTGDMFPKRYKNGAFIAFHGSWNRAPLEQKGHRVVFVPFQDGKLATDKWEEFATGFPHTEHVVNANDAKYKPIGLAQGSDGSLYIADSRKGRIWRIVYRGDTPRQEQFNTSPHPKVEQEVIDVENSAILEGKEQFSQYCMTCHQQDGMGVSGMTPPLSGSSWVLGNKDRLIKVVLNGLSRNVEIDGVLYSNSMGSFASLSDKDIALILTYVRRNFGNVAGPVSEQEVTSVRASIK